MARCAARGAHAAGRRQPPGRLLPQALVVAALAGGTSAFVTQDRAVTLDVDGTRRTLHTYADDVAELLTEEGLAVGAHDVVEPGPARPLAGGDEVVLRHGRPLTLTLDGERRRVWTTARTVAEALDELGVRVAGAYLSLPRETPVPRHGLTFAVRTARRVTFMADGREHTVVTNAATVRDAVREAGLTLHGEDTTSVPGDSFPRDGQTVSVLRITGTTEYREVAVPFRTVRRPDPTVFRGTEVVTRTGAPGVERIAYEVRTVNGVRQRPRRTGTETLRSPVDRVVRFGTRPLPTSVAGADGLDWDAMARCESGGRPDAVDASGTYGGLYQLDAHTWRDLGGQGRPQDAPAAEQTYRAKKLYVQRGASPWPGCGRKLHR
ncbi:resuscitation-promoting factor [Streptomyces sp. XD-27]|uniref:resuscitation-promoting factor n=1 Tax=Streptomyces sp. XD-27 TaxID=3062779 RepID=UPI0026F47E16|nr:resuscitation-promoting factor [Streptomyces sp. XD-27]WKX74396.1 ubiquitin-like domain-containing protein [Streptomyces sp. XD-27]